MTTNTQLSGLVLPKFAQNKLASNNNNNNVPKVVKPYSPQLIPPRVSPTRSLLSNVAIPSVVPTITPGICLPRLKTPNKVTIINNTELPDVDPWLPPKLDNDPVMIKIAAMTPVGTIAMVPTAEKRPPHTPRRQPVPPTNNARLKIVEEKDPLLNASIYLDLSKDNRDYNYVAEHMRSIAATTIDLQRRYITQYQSLPNIQGKVSSQKFEELLNIYENNQVFYQDRLDDKQMTLFEIQKGLTQLEYWFMKIIEPVSTDDIEAWKQREQNKLITGYSSYCDPELHKHITPAPLSLRNEIQILQTY